LNWFTIVRIFAKITSFAVHYFVCGSFSSSLCYDTLEDIEKIASEKYHDEKCMIDKTTIFLNLIKERDSEFKKIDTQEIII